MQDFLFRVFDKEKKEMSNVFSFQLMMINFPSEPDVNFPIQFIAGRPDRFVVMQWTGLTTLYDDPVKIFDHDFVKIYFANKTILCLVKWDCDDGGYRFEEVNGDEYYTYSELIHYDDFEKMEIAENCYQNPELLGANNAS
jgi:hypothetical protein